jgi:enoyl-CoA hydratase
MISLIYSNKVRCIIEGAIALITIDNPPVNSLNFEVMEGLATCFDDLYKNNDIRVVIITGEGKQFVAGADIKEFVSWTPDNAKMLTQRGQHIFTTIENYARPVIAAVNGVALGGGLELCLVADIRIASEKAKFGLPEVGLGIIPAYGGSTRLSRVVNEGQAKKMIYTGELINAAEAKEIGLVQEVVAAEALMERAMQLARKISENAPIAITCVKKVINSNRETTIEENLINEAEAAEICFNSKDKEEGVDAFINKRKANFRNI